MSEKFENTPWPQESRRAGFNFDCDFTEDAGWDVSVTTDEFNQLANEAADIIGGIKNKAFKDKVASLSGHREEVKKMVIKYLG